VRLSDLVRGWRHAAASRAGVPADSISRRRQPGATSSIGNATVISTIKLVCKHISAYVQPSPPGLGAPMTVTTMTSREFNQDASGAKKAARRGPVFITDRGRPAHVLLTIEDYQRLAGGKISLAEALAQPAADLDFEAPRLSEGIYKPADLDDVRA
jgi:prevent-host-death family protein